MYKVINTKTGKRVFQDDFKTKTEGEQAIVNSIRGASTRTQALKYYRALSVRKL